MKLCAIITLFFVGMSTVAMEVGDVSGANNNKDEEINLALRNKNPDLAFQSLISRLLEYGYFNESGDFAIPEFHVRVFETLLIDFEYGGKIIKFINSKISIINDDVDSNDIEAALICWRLYLDTMGLSPLEFDDEVLKYIASTDNNYLLKIFIELYKTMLDKCIINIEDALVLACFIVTNNSDKCRLVFGLDIIGNIVDYHCDQRIKDKIKIALESDNMAEMVNRFEILSDKLAKLTKLLEGIELLGPPKSKSGNNEKCIVS